MRKCSLIESSQDNKRHIYIDDLNAGEIFDYLDQDERHRKKFRFIKDLILGGHKNKQIYSSEAIDIKTSNVTAMKFFPGQENDRIYCKEYQTTKGSVIIIAAELLTKKKQTKLKHKEISIIKTVGYHEYEIPEF